MEIGIANILIIAASASMIVKVIVDAIKTIPNLQVIGWRSLLIAFLASQLVSFALAYSTIVGLSMNMQIASTYFLVGVMAFGGAVGVTELHKKGEELKNG